MKTNLSSKALRSRAWLLVLALMTSSQSGEAQIQTAGTLFVNFDATALTPGTTGAVTNSGSLGGLMEARMAAGALTNAIVGTTNGVTGVFFPSTYCMTLVNGVGGAFIPPPSGLVGANATASIEAWVFNPSPADDETMVAWGNRAANQNMAFQYGYNGTFGAVQHSAAGTGDMPWDPIGGSPLNNKWHHLVYTYDGAVQSVYVDGALANSKAISFNTATNAGISFAAEWNATGTAIGTTPALSTLALARVRIHDGALTPAQILNNFNFEKAAFIPVPPTPVFLSAGPVHRYSFNEPATNDAGGLPINDSVGTAHGVVQSSQQNQMARFSGRRLVLPGGLNTIQAGFGGPYGDLPNGLVSVNSTNNGGSGELSIEIWYKNNAGTMWASSRLFEAGSSGVVPGPGVEVTQPGGFLNSGGGLDYIGYTAQNGANVNQHRLQWSNRDVDPGGGVTNGSVAADTITMGSYQTDRHVVLTWKESTGQVLAYENGGQANVIIVSNAMSTLNDVNVWLGRSVNSVNDTGFAGEYDEVRFYNYVLSPGQVLADFQVGPNTVNTAESVVAIATQPQNVTINQGWPASFIVSASGSPTVSYQWRRNGTPISGATTDTLVLDSVTMANNGDSYSCVVSNFAGGTPHSLTSSSAVLTVAANQVAAEQVLHETKDANPSVAIGSQRNNFTGLVGGSFQVGTANPVITHLGYYDLYGDGLAINHRVGVFSASSGALLASVEVPSGTGAYFTNGYRWVALSSPLILSNTASYVLAAEVFNADGDSWADQFAPALWNSYYVGTNGSSTRVSRFVGAAWPTFPSGTSSANAIYGAPNMANLSLGAATVGMQQTTVTQFAGANVTLTAAVGGQAPVSLQWYKAPSTLLAGKTNTTLSLPSVTVADSGDYYVIASNTFGPVQGANVSLTVLADTPVSITQQPVSISVPDGFSATFTIGTFGTTPIGYQWNRNGTPIAGATESRYTLPVVSMANSGEGYSCVVSNFANGAPRTATSSTATLTVIPNKALPVQILHETVNGNRDNFSGMVGGIFKVGASDALVTHVGYYDINEDGLIFPHRIGIFNANGGSLVGFATVPAGTDGYLTNGYRWAALDSPLVLSNNGSFVLAAEVFASSGDGWPDIFAPTNWNTYFVGASEAATRFSRYGGTWPGIPVSTTGGSNMVYGAPNLATLPIGTPVAVVQQTNVTKYVGESVTLSALVNGQAPLTLQWYKAPGTLLAGQTNSTLTFSSLTMANGGNYYVVATSPAGNTQSGNVTLNVLALTAPIVTQQPLPQSVYVHQRATFSVSAIGQQPLSYQWNYAGVPIAGATSSTLTVLDVTAAKAGNYNVTITNALGSVNSSAAALTLLALPAGSYEAAVIDGTPLVFYRFSEVNGGTNAAFNLGSLGVAHNGTYEGAYSGGAGPQPPAFPIFEATNSSFASDGLSADVQIPALNLNTNSGSRFTITSWIKKNGPQQAYAGIVFHRGGVGASGLGVKPDLGGNDILTYHWNSLYFDYNSGLIVPDSQWVFAALVVDPAKAVFYLQDGSGMLSATNTAAHAPNDFSGQTFVGWDSNSGTGSPNRRFYGEIDEVMVFDRALTASEIYAIYNAAIAPAVELEIVKSGNSLILSWPTGVLQQADEAAGPYSDMTGVTSPFTNAPGALKKFYRVKVQ